MTLVMEKDEPFDPTYVRLFCVATEVSRPDGLADSVKELGLLHFRGVRDPDNLQGWLVRSVGRPAGAFGKGPIDHLRSLPNAEQRYPASRDDQYSRSDFL
jgi:hypothetical protein